MWHWEDVVSWCFITLCITVVVLGISFAIYSAEVKNDEMCREVALTNPDIISQLDDCRVR